MIGTKTSRKSLTTSPSKESALSVRGPDVGQWRRAVEGSSRSLVVWLAFAMSLPLSCPGQTRGLCFAYLRQGDIYVDCDGATTQITRRGDIDDFAVDGKRPSVGSVASRTISGTAGGTEVAFTATVVDLKSLQTRRVVDGEDGVIATCGGIFWTHGANRQGSGTRNLLTDEDLRFSTYPWFRCSSDRSVVLGQLNSSGSGVYIGFPPRATAAGSSDVDPYQFDVSPDGSKLVYSKSGRPLCVLSIPGTAKCLASHDTLADIPSINSLGEVLVATATADECFYLSRGVFGRERMLGATDASRDACLAVGYWSAGLGSIKIVELVARNPQWISPKTAALLRGWARRGAGAHK